MAGVEWRASGEVLSWCACEVDAANTLNVNLLTIPPIAFCDLVCGDANTGIQEPLLIPERCEEVNVFTCCLLPLVNMSDCGNVQVIVVIMGYHNQIDIRQLGQLAWRRRITFRSKKPNRTSPFAKNSIEQNANASCFLFTFGRRTNSRRGG